MLLLVPGRYYRHTLIVWICVWTQNGWTQGTEPSKGLCRHDNSVECCWGWRQTEWGRCQPLCQQGCKHGVCVGADRCQCHSGYTGKACNHDVNECGLKPRPCKHRCVNTSGSFKCFCMNGFTLESDGSCRNARTCYHANCQYGCEVMKGAVRCTCPSPGLRLGPDQRTCVDVDECASGSFVCPRRRKCVNTFGSYLCTCHLGFRLVYVNRRYTCVNKDSRTFCSLNPVSPKCRCKDGRCRDVPTESLDPPQPRATITITPVTMSTPATTTKPVTTARPVTTTTTVTTTTMVPTTTPVTTTTLVTTTTMVPTTTTTATTPPAVNDATTITTTTEASSVARCMTTTTAVTMTTTVTPVTTTISNRIGKDVTHKQRGDVHIPRHPAVNHVWEFDVELGMTADDARDDPDAGVEFSCGFEHGLCDWISDGDGDLHWDVVVRPAGGRYLSVPELKAGQSSIRGARLVIHIPMFRGGALCFSFSHWLTGHHVGVLQLFVRRKGHNQRYGSALWSRTGGYGWRNTQVTMTTNSLDRVLLKAERRTGGRGQVAVDDITLKQGACP
ncbi:nephronectin-like isoform X2 [Gouania willdenowi]|uniref:nephronectin-like isoform X2 n=1 Tax=Gouania willdenowi TaxID=441366 RepID=UPI0010567AAA|nr:nephronectin-like isoform X2 [Gouania willdenowi]